MPNFIPKSYNKPGFHDSDHTYVEAIIYQHGDEPIVLSSSPAAPLLGFKFDGRTQLDPSPSVINVHTHKDLGSASGTFSITVKPSREAETLFKRLVDDDWIDIVFYKNDEGYHVMRGLIDEIRRPRRVGGTGATVENFVISGRDFGKIWESTPIWFSPIANDFITSIQSKISLQYIPEMSGHPGKVPLVFLKTFIEPMFSMAGINWDPPKGMPGLMPGTFLRNVNFQESKEELAAQLLDSTKIGSSKYFQNKPQRLNFNPNGISPDGMAWDLAKEYSDPNFTELYVDILPNGDPFSPRISLGDPISPLETQMAVVIRDKPFLVSGSVMTSLVYLPSWATLPTHTLARQEIVDDDVGRSGFERYNAFYVTPKVSQELLQTFGVQAMAPFIDKNSIKRHGLRRLDVLSSVLADTLNGVTEHTLNLYQKMILRDWYCLNPYFLSGTITTGHGRPDIKIGSKLRIPGVFSINPLDNEPDETYYIESVDQDWTAGPGMRTSIGVTRGWLGTDIDYQLAINKMSANYVLGPSALAVP